METTTTNELGTDITIRIAVDSPGCRAYRREERYAVHSTGVIRAVQWSGLALAGLVAMAAWRMVRLRQHGGNTA